MPSFLMIKERSYSSAIFVGKPLFQNIWKIYFFSCICLRKIIFHFLPKEKGDIFGEKKYHLSLWYKTDHIPVQFLWKDHLFRTFGKRKHGFLCSDFCKQLHSKVSLSWAWNNIELRLFQPPVFAGCLFEPQYRPLYEHWVPYVKRIPLQSI